jgi:hypothetical protein
VSEADRPPQSGGTEVFGAGAAAARQQAPAYGEPVFVEPRAPALPLKREMSGRNTTPLIVAGLAGILVVSATIALLALRSSNKPPRVQAIDVIPSSVRKGEDVTLTARAIDADKDALSYQWNASAGRITGEGETVLLDTSGIDTSSGRAEVSIRLSVSDGRGEAASANQTVTVLPANQMAGPPLSSLPLVVNLDAGQKQIAAGESVNLSAQVQNRDPGELTFEWKTSGGIIEPNGQSASLRTAGLQLNGASRQVAVTVTVRDASGNSQSDTQTITLVSAAATNWPPSVKVRASRPSVQQGEELEITAEASDRDGDTVSYSWRASGGQIAGSGSRITLKTSATRPGAVEVTATVADARGESSSDRVTILVTPPPNHAPSITSLNANKSGVRAGESIYLTALATDPDGDALTYSWKTSAGAIRGSGQSVRIETAGVGDSTIRVSVSVTDQRGGEAYEAASFAIEPEPRRPTIEEAREPRAGPVSVSVQPEDSDNFIAVLTGNAGPPQSSSGTIEITVMPGGSGTVRGYLPAAVCQFDIVFKENVSQASIAGTPGPGNNFSRMRVRIRPKNTGKPVKVVISWVRR